MGLIRPRTLRGFRDLLPEQALRRADMVRRIEDVFQRHGYGPIDTPVLEFAEILKGKGGGETDKEIIEFVDRGGREVAFRFDLTVPLARFVAQHEAKLVFPFRRYHIGLAYRGERPQRGRSREFMQCDADLVGPVSETADAETLVVMSAVYEALAVGDVTIRMSDRRVLAGIMETIGELDRTVPIVRILDKREKLGDQAVRSEMTSLGLGAAKVDRILAICRPRETNAETLDALDDAITSSDVGRVAVSHLRRVYELVLAAGVPEVALRLDPSIARALDYYTGVVFEAQLDDMPEIGSVGSGGRYDDLAGLYTESKLPGVGCSIGVTRLLDAVAELGKRQGTHAVTDAMLIHPHDSARVARSVAFAASLRNRGVKIEMYPEPKKHAVQMRYADRRGIPFVFTQNDDGGFHGKRMHDGAAAATADAAAAFCWMQTSRQ